MKKAIISLALAFLGIANLYAVKAKPGIAKIMSAMEPSRATPAVRDETFTTTCCWTYAPAAKNRKCGKITAES